MDVIYSMLLSGGTTSMNNCMKYVNLSERKERKVSSLAAVTKL
jgi:hypothetical protein